MWQTVGDALDVVHTDLWTAESVVYLPARIGAIRS